MALRREGDTYRGWLEQHRLCVESMASARACADRTGVSPKELKAVNDYHPAWDDVAYYLAQLCLTITYMVSPHVIVMSGGVMQRESLFKKVREHFLRLNEGYINAPIIMHNIQDFIKPSIFKNQIGLIGAIELARRAAVGIPDPAHAVQ